MIEIAICCFTLIVCFLIIGHFASEKHFRECEHEKWLKDRENDGYKHALDPMWGRIKAMDAKIEEQNKIINSLALRSGFTLK